MTIDPNASTEVRAVRAHCIAGRPVQPGTVYSVGAAQAAELIANGRVVLTDPDTRHVVGLAARTEAARCARTGRGGFPMPPVY